MAIGRSRAARLSSPQAGRTTVSRQLSALLRRKVIKCCQRCADVAFIFHYHQVWFIMSSMILIQFPDRATEEKALGFLAGRCSFKSFDDGTTLVPDAILGLLASQGIRFTVEGKAVYDQIVPTIRGTASPQVQ